MNSSASIVLFALLVGLTPVSSSDKQDKTPMQQVVNLIGDLKSKVEADGKSEQKSFDAYACWCEKTLARKAADISASKELITETQILMEKLKGEIASHGAEIAQLNKDIAQNLASQKEATQMRTKEYNEYFDEKSESEQCIGAMEAAIRVLTGAGIKKGFLDTSIHKTQLMVVASSLRRMLGSAMPQSVSAKDLELVKMFATKPEDFMSEHRVSMSAAQVGQNPFGDYAPQSTQIQGILKGMYDAFTADLEKDNFHEAESQKSFEALMATKREEKKTLDATLEIQETSQAAKTKKLKESQVLQDDTQDQLDADEAFFTDSKEACQVKAKEWSIRTRLRTEEIAGMNEAIAILSGGDATFKKATAVKSKAEVRRFFLQLKSVSKHHAVSSEAKQRQAKAYGELRKLATKYLSLKVARIAAAVEAGGHFDKVMVQIDGMIALLRKEEAEDIVHRDLCENSLNANKNDQSESEHNIQKIERIRRPLAHTKRDIFVEYRDLKGLGGRMPTGIKRTKKSITELLGFRNKENKEFVTALKDDTDAVALIRQAIVSLSKFYKDNKIPLALSQKAIPSKPEYAKNPDKAPESDSFSSDYGGQKSQSGGILAILEMLAEDLEKEIADGRGDDADAQTEYAKQNEALQSTLDAQQATKVNLEMMLAGTDAKIDAAEAYHTAQYADLKSEKDVGKAMELDCAWAFDRTRTKARIDEIDGLVDAKGFLAGVDAGEDPLPALP